MLVPDVVRLLPTFRAGENRVRGACGHESCRLSHWKVSHHTRIRVHSDKIHRIRAQCCMVRRAGYAFQLSLSLISSCGWKLSALGGRAFTRIICRFASSDGDGVLCKSRDVPELCIAKVKLVVSPRRGNLAHTTSLGKLNIARHRR